MNPGRSGLFHGEDLNSEINVTPFVDVALVLLIIFMVAAPMMTVGIPVDLPRAALSELPREQEKPIDIFIDKDGGLFLGDQPVSNGMLAPALAILPPESKAQRVRIRADKEARYEFVMAVFETLTVQGYSHIGLVAMPKPEQAVP
ncbi:ExbD/TolR family protein [Aestuariivirga sp.]|uniref:ExbD/TolR family protein n=1 Tax=Aestuariivirga sp. TaxID=2650926 RepID=UPI003BAA2F94